MKATKKLENALLFLNSVNGGCKPKVGEIEENGKIVYYLYMGNPFYNPEIQGEPPALTLEFKDLEWLVENTIIIADE